MHGERFHRGHFRVAADRADGNPRHVASDAYNPEVHADCVEVAEIHEAIAAIRARLCGDGDVRTGESRIERELLEQARAIRPPGLVAGEVRGSERALTRLDRHDVTVHVAEGDALAIRRRRASERIDRHNCHVVPVAADVGDRRRGAEAGDRVAFVESVEGAGHRILAVITDEDELCARRHRAARV